MENSNHIKRFNEGFKDIVLGTKRFETNREEYLSQFKKSFEQRTKSENILVECLYKVEFLNSMDRRFLGAAEAVLIMEDYLKPGGNFEYGEKKEKFLFMTFKTKERYDEYIIRLVKEYLKENNVL